jgi:transposase
MPLIINASAIWVSTKPVDFRQAIDGLCQCVLEKFSMKPQEGLYVFYNRRKNRLKLLVWHHNGFMLIVKRLEKGRFCFRFSASIEDKLVLQEKQLQAILLGLNWQMISDWESLNFESFC